MQSLTADGRDRSLDYKISGFHVPPGSFDAQVLALCSLQGNTTPIPHCWLGTDGNPTARVCLRVFSCRQHTVLSRL